jgi:hypothetical protein
MKKSRRLVSIVVSALVISGAVGAGPARSSESDQLIDKSLKNSGMAAQLETLPEIVISCIPDDAIPDKRTRRETVNLIKETAGKEVLLSAVRAAIKENLDNDKLQAVLKFYDSRIGKKVGRLYETVLDPELIRDLREKRTILAALNENRVATLERIVSAGGFSEANANLLNAVVEGLVEGYTNEVSKTDRPNNETKKQIRIALKEAIVGSNRSREFALVGLARTLQSLDDKELQEFALFCTSDAGTWFNRSVQKGLENAVTKTGVALGTAVARWRLHSEKGSDEKAMQNQK